MKNSKFTEAYLAIINEENEGFSAGPEETTDVSQGTENTGSNNLQVVCFKTSDKNLIDAINSGFDEVVFFVKAKDEVTGEDTVQEVKFGPESFEDFEVKADGEGTCPECGTEPCSCEKDDAIENECGDGAIGENGAVEGEDTNDADGGDVSGEDTGDGDGGDVSGEDTGDGAVEGEDTGDTIDEEPETIDPSEWLEDGVCVKCGDPECDGSCKCKKCGSQNCIGDCEGGEGEEQGEDVLGAVGGGLAGYGVGGIPGAVGGAFLGSKL